MKIRGILVVLLCAFLLVSCGGKSEPEPEVLPEPSPPPISKSESIIGNIPEGSILLFQDDEGAAKLNKDMEEGRIPEACYAMYDEMGSRPAVETTDPEVITEMYNRLGQMIIGGESQESITDCYHYIFFKLQDGTNVGWRFEGTGLLCWGPSNYEVESTGNLWKMVRAMQDEMIDGVE